MVKGGIIITEKFEQDFEELRKHVIGMGQLARFMLDNSVKALKNQDVELANKVLARKEEIMKMDSDIEEETLRILLLYQPMARDLRTIATIFKMITYLARVGRYGKDIATLAIEMSAQPHVKKLVSIPHIADIVCGMIDDALEAFRTGELGTLEDFGERDDEADEIRYSIFRECLSYMMEDPRTITRCAHYIMIARYLERCGDHACKMAEKIHYMITGERVEIR